MATPVKLPPIATDTTEGTLVRWLVDVGERVEPGQVIAEVDTAKVLFEVETPVAGTVIGLAASIGDDVVVGATLAWIGEPGEAVRAPASNGGELSRTPEPRAGSADPSETVRAAPIVRRLAERLDVDLSRVRGSGPGGRVLRKDVERAASGADEPAQPARGERMLTAIGAAMSRAKREVPHFYTGLEIDTTAREGEIAEHGFTAVLLHCVARALAAHPVLNATYEEGRGVVAASTVNLGVAVAVDEGLVVPVLHGAERLALAELQARLENIVTEARAGRLGAADVEGVTFTVSNAGMTGVDTIVPIVYQPAIAILGVGRRSLRPAVVADAVVPRLTVQLVLSCDHRAVNGLQAAEWLVEVGRELEGRG